MANNFKNAFVCILLILYTMPIVLSQSTFKAPVFYDKDTIPSFPEMLAEPGSNIYGSTIHIWHYVDTKNDTIKEIAVTGHAESRTCQKMSSLFFNSYFQKNPDQGDFFVAGAGRLINNSGSNQLKELKILPEVQTYLNAKYKLKIALLLLDTSDPDDPDLPTLKHNADSLTNIIEKTQIIPVVKKYIQLSQSVNVLDELVSEANKIRQESGLVETHKVPYQVITTIREQVQMSIKKNSRKLLTFENLLEEYDLDEAVVWIDIHRLTDGKTIDIRLPSSLLSRESFEKAKNENRNQVIVAMQGDAQRRLLFVQKGKRDAEFQRKKYYQMDAKVLDEIIVLNRCINILDGYEYDCPEGTETRMTRRQYRDNHLPQLIKDYEIQIKYLQDLQIDISDSEEEKSKRIDELNYTTLIDAMLRGWDLPVGRSQEAFRVWCNQERDKIWRYIHDALRLQQIDPTVISGSNMVFDIFYEKDELVIKPYLLLDLRRSILVLDPKKNATYVENTWDHRRTIDWAGETVLDTISTLASINLIDQLNEDTWKAVADQESFDEINTLSQSALNIIYGKENSNNILDVEDIRLTEIFDDVYLQKFSKYRDSALALVKNNLLYALNHIPEEAWVYLESKFRTYPPQSMLAKQQAIEDLQNILSSEDVKKCIPRLEDVDSPESFISHLNNYYNCLEKSPNIPIDYHFKFALLLGELIPGKKEQSTWSKIEEITRRGSRSKELTYYSLNLKRKGLNFDIFDEINKRITLIKQRENAYYEQQRMEDGQYEEHSEEYRRLILGTMHEISFFTSYAIPYIHALSQMKCRTYAQNAEFHLWKGKGKVLDKPLKELQLAIEKEPLGIDSAYIAVRNRLETYIRDRRKPDTLALVEMSTLLNNGCESALRSVARQEENPVLPGHKDIISRALYEMGNYNSAFDMLFPDKISLINYSSRLSWVEGSGDTADEPESMSFLWQDKVLVCQAQIDGESLSILQIKGLTEDQGHELSEYLNELPIYYWSHEGLLSQQILSVPVLQSPSNRILHEITKDKAIRTAILKIMAYRRAFPASDLIPLSEFDMLSEEDRKVSDRKPVRTAKAVIEPTLKELRIKLSSN